MAKDSPADARDAVGSLLWKNHTCRRTDKPEQHNY